MSDRAHIATIAPLCAEAIYSQINAHLGSVLLEVIGILFADPADGDLIDLVFKSHVPPYF